jgi:protein-S-isoprenylcysteine O-methyltransferase Ste14
MVTVYIIAYVLLLSFFLIEKFIRKGDDAKTLKKTEYDKGSTNLLGFTFVISSLLLIAAPVLNYYKTGAFKMPVPINILGLLIMASGITIRVIAVSTLGKYYTRTLRKKADHEIVSNGIYKYIRHPGYLGNILLFLGAGIAMGNIFAFIVIFVLVLSTYVYRIKIEEKMLNDIFGEKYKEYFMRTKKLIPFIY